MESLMKIWIIEKIIRRKKNLNKEWEKEEFFWNSEKKKKEKLQSYWPKWNNRQKIILLLYMVFFVRLYVIGWWFVDRWCVLIVKNEYVPIGTQKTSGSCVTWHMRLTYQLNWSRWIRLRYMHASIGYLHNS